MISITFISTVLMLAVPQLNLFHQSTAPASNVSMGYSYGSEYDVQDYYGYAFNLPKGGDSMEIGPDGFPIQVQYKKTDTLLLADVRETVSESLSFTESPVDTALRLKELSVDNLGEELLELHITDFYHADSGLYVFEYSSTRAETNFYTTVCYYFGENYTAEFMAIGPDKEWSYKIAHDTAVTFVDLGGEARWIGYRPTPGLGAQWWDYPYLHNPFAISQYFMDLESPSKERQNTDYVIEWKDKGVETLIRKLLDKPDVPIMSSDLDRFRSLSINCSQSDYYSIMANELDAHITAGEVEVQSIEDIKEFNNLISVDIQLPNLTDLSPLSSMTGLEVLMFRVSSEIDGLDWMEPLENLRLLRITGWYPNITDVQVLGKLQKLESVLLHLENLKDLSIFAQLPNLEELEVSCSEDADTEPVRNAENIVRLFINAEEVRYKYRE